MQQQLLLLREANVSCLAPTASATSLVNHAALKLSFLKSNETFYYKYILSFILFLMCLKNESWDRVQHLRGP